ncbi:MAG TPA: hypothetical protein VMM18_02435 [Gemmatimonadaceae bacterium]|nr:hypothetical protein [Gemmatimonadaceae bacterium]
MIRDRMGPHGEERDDAVTRLLRETYAPPADEGYWAALEAAIMARVTGERGSWRDVFAGWVPAGVAAAAVALGVLGLALWQERAVETRIAYEQTMRGAAPMSVQTVAPPSPLSEREAILQLVMSR